MCNRILVVALICASFAHGQQLLKGKIIADSTIDFSLCKIGIQGTAIVVEPDSTGRFTLSYAQEKPVVHCFCAGFEPVKQKIVTEKELIFKLNALVLLEDEVNVTSWVKEKDRKETPIITNTYDKRFFNKNPTSNMLDMLERMNGVRSQVNCNVCGTGDIHLNGLEGPYTLIVLDGVPIVGGLSSVYGLSGIPSFLLDKIEVTKGPASSMFGSEALAGVIHAYTKKNRLQKSLEVQHISNSHGEFNTSLGFSAPLKKNWSYFGSVDHFYFQTKLDQNADLFTDVPLQHRISSFHRFQMARKSKKTFFISTRYMYEDRWGGQLDWNRGFRGGDSVYAESIYLNRGEASIFYQLPGKEHFSMLAHVNVHDQNSYYGTQFFAAKQLLQFNQLTWTKTVNKQEFLAGLSSRYSWYDDNTILTQLADSLQSNVVLIQFTPGIFWQHDWKNKRWHLLYSVRLDHHNAHGFIPTPRMAFTYHVNEKQSIRLHTGSGFRIVNLFSEDHAALTGSRKVVIEEALKPERSWSANASYLVEKKVGDWASLDLDLQGFYTHFFNRIVPDYVSNPNEIRYSNSPGVTTSKGVSMDVSMKVKQQLTVELGATVMEVNQIEGNLVTQQLLTEHWSGNWTISYYFQKRPISIDYTGTLVGPMRLPLLSTTDPRPEFSKAYSIQNVQVSYKYKQHSVFFVGVKNLLNWTPAKGIPFLIARANDPFDKNVQFDQNGQAIATTTNPNALTFDPSYVYAPNQGIRFFVGFRMTVTQK